MRDEASRIEALSPVKQQLLLALRAQRPEAPPAGERQQRTEAQSALIKIWKSVLDVASIDIDDNYFQLGGDSIKSISIVALARKAGIPLTTRLLLAHPTVSRLAAALADAAPVARAGAAAATSALDEGYPLTPLQLGILYESAAAPDSVRYQSIISLSVRGPIDSSLFRLAWNKVFLDHPVLRNRFDLTGSNGPRQLASADAECDLVTIDCDDETAAKSALTELKAEFARSTKQLDRGSLIRIGIVSFAHHRHFLVLAHHHIILDGWSQQLILSRLFSIYSGYLDGRDTPIEPAPSFRDFVEKIVQPASQPTPFWRSYLAGHRVSNPLTRDGGAGDVVHHHIPVSAASARGLSLLSIGSVVPLATVLQAISILALSRLTDQEDIVYGLTTSGRDATSEGDLTQVVGLCINTVAVRQRLPRDGDVGKWLGDVRDGLLEIMPYQHASLVAVKREVLGAEAPRLFEALVVIENLPMPRIDDASLEVALESFEVEEGWPIVMTFHPGERPAIELRLQPARCRPGLPSQLEQALTAALGVLCESAPSMPMEALRTTFDQSLRDRSRESGLGMSTRTRAS